MRLMTTSLEKLIYNSRKEFIKLNLKIEIIFLNMKVSTMI